MTTTPQIILHNLSFSIEHTPVRFDNINLSFEKAKYGVVGRNGVGKTTLLKLIMHELTPDSGSIQHLCSIANVPQWHSGIDEHATIRDVLEVTPILKALARIHKGGLNENDFDIVADHWDIQNRIVHALSVFNLWPIDLELPFHHLGGGQKTKVLLAKTLLFSADFFLFDEPTNNLDAESRNILYHYIEASENGMMIASHDRALLNKCEKIIEITTKGIEVYGGNYDFYKKQKEMKELALAQEIQARTEILKKSKKTIQTRMERHEKNESRGRKEKIKQIKGKGQYNKIEIKSKQGKSESTNRRIRLQSEKKLEAVNEALIDARAKLEVQEDLNMILSATLVPNKKTVVKIENLCFSYNNQTPLINKFNLNIIGPERIAIPGPNGSGKSTLIKLIKGEITPQRGSIIKNVTAITYLDQSVSFLDSNLSILENFLKFNPESSLFDAYSALARFKFRNKDAEKQVNDLSGGEKIRAGLAIALSSKNPPKFIILDEPTNHLDLDAIQAIEKALTLYQGAMLVVSHDKTFLHNIGISRVIYLK